MMWYNTEFDDLMKQAELTLDPAVQNPLIKEAGKILSAEIPAIPFTLVPNRNYWWPWVKNYYGELTVTDDACMADLVRFMWIDEGLKEDMGY